MREESGAKERETAVCAIVLMRNEHACIALSLVSSLDQKFRPTLSEAQKLLRSVGHASYDISLCDRPAQGQRYSSNKGNLALRYWLLSPFDRADPDGAHHEVHT